MRTVTFKHMLPVALLSALALSALPTVAALAATSSPAALTGGSPTPTTVKPTLATWFGPGFYGHATACGQTMTPALVGVASRTLPCGTLVQINYRGQQLTVPVLDRGPYGHTGAIWDLTAGTARALKIKDTVRISTQIVGSVPNAPTLGLAPALAPSVGPTPAAVAPPATAPPVTAAATGGAAAG